jgi:hypothetical protein
VTIRRVRWDNIPEESKRLAWVTWLERYGIDPHDVGTTPGWLEADDDTRTVTFLELVRDTDGRVMLDPANPGRAWTRPRVVQLDAPALPFPEAL